MAGRAEIDLAIELAEAETGVRRAGAKLRLCAAPATASRAWSAEEEKFLEENRGRLSESAIAAHLGRTVCSIDNHVKREMHLCAPSKDPRILTAEHIAMGLGLDGKSVHKLIDTGLMAGRRLPHKDVTRVVDRVAFLRWICEPAHWIYFKTDRVGAMRPRGKRGGMSDVYDFVFWEDARELVEAARGRWRDAWLTSGQAAELLGISGRKGHGAAHNINKAILLGNLKATRYGNWWIRATDMPDQGLTINAPGRLVPKVKPKYVCPRGLAHAYFSTCMKLRFCREARASRSS